LQELQALLLLVVLSLLELLLVLLEGQLDIKLEDKIKVKALKIWNFIDLEIKKILIKIKI